MKYALVFGYGQKRNGELLTQTKRRCDKAVELFEKKEIGQIYLLAHQSKNNRSMAHEMRRYLVGRGVPFEYITVARRAGNTAGELSVFSRFVEDGDVVLISTWFHIPRIWWLSKFFLRGRAIRLVPVWKTPVNLFFDLALEPLRILKAVLRPVGWAEVEPLPPALEY